MIFKIYITENGLDNEDPIIEDEIVDIPRIKYIDEHLRHNQKNKKDIMLCL